MGFGGYWDPTQNSGANAGLATIVNSNAGPTRHTFTAVKAAETAPAEPIELKEKPRRKPLPDHLERIEQVLSVGEDCPECGGDLSKLGEDITEELEYIPGRFVVNKITRPRMACRRCEAISVDQGPTLQQSRLMIADS